MRKAIGASDKATAQLLYNAASEISKLRYELAEYRDWISLATRTLIVAVACALVYVFVRILPLIPVLLSELQKLSLRDVLENVIHFVYAQWWLLPFMAVGVLSLALDKWRSHTAIKRRK